MAPSVLILGHSFVRRLRRDLENGFDCRADASFNLQGRASVHLFGVGGRTVEKLLRHDLHVVSALTPDIVILEIGTNDLSSTRPEVVGSAIEDLVRVLTSQFSVRVVGVCHVIPRGLAQCSDFNEAASILNQYNDVVLQSFPKVFCWRHRVFITLPKILSYPMAFMLILLDSINCTAVTVAPC